MNNATLAWKNFQFNRLNSLLSILLIAFGVGLLTLLILFQEQFKNQFEKNQAGIDLVVGAKGSPLQLILSNMFHVDSPTGNINIGDAKFLFNEKHPLIDLAVPLSIGDSYSGFRIIGTSTDYLTLYPAELQVGEIWHDDYEVSIGSQVAQTTGLKIGDTFFSSHGFNAGDLEHDEGDPFRVVGIFEPHGSVIDRLILCNISTIWDVHQHDHSEDNHGHQHAHTIKQPEERFQILDHPDKAITSILVTWKAGKERSLPVINMPRSINENTPVMATAPAYELNKLLAQVGSGLKAIQYLAYLIAIISGISIFISMYNNLKNRKRELAIMRIGGATPWNLFSLVQIEALYIGILGGVLGILMGYIGSFLISKLLQTSYNYSIFSLEFHPQLLWLFSGTLFLSALSALIPSYIASQTKVIV